MSWQVGDLLGHRVNVELGPGRVEELDGRRVTLFFRRSGNRGSPSMRPTKPSPRSPSARATAARSSLAPSR